MGKGLLSADAIQRLRPFKSKPPKEAPPPADSLYWSRSRLPFQPAEEQADAVAYRVLWEKEEQNLPLQGVARLAAEAKSDPPEPSADEPSEPAPAPDEPPELDEYDAARTFEEGISAARQRRAELLAHYQTSDLQGFSDRNMLEMLLHFAIPYRNTAGIADDLLAQFGNLPSILNAGIHQTINVPGMTLESSVLIDMVMKVAQRAVERQNEATDLLDTDEKVGAFLLRKFFGMTRETLLLLCLDNSCRLISCTQLSKGVSNRTGIDLRTICETAFRCNAPVAILAHNHPGGRAYPSDEDIRVTRRIQEMLHQLDIELVDHFIIAGDQWKSMAKMGELSVVRVTRVVR
jgi:DNA repair protein RadC